MYKQSAEAINKGLSRGARALLGSVAALFGVAMIAIGSSEVEDKPLALHVFGGFCLLISIACLTRGRVRQFIGSVVGSLIFLAGLAYLGTELVEGKFWSLRSSDPTAAKALSYLLMIGLPGAAYACKARFGFGKKR